MLRRKGMLIAQPLLASKQSAPSTALSSLLPHTSRRSIATYANPRVQAKVEGLAKLHPSFLADLKTVQDSPHVYHFEEGKPGTRNRFNPETRTVALVNHTHGLLAGGDDEKAAHETHHASQHARVMAHYAGPSASTKTEAFFNNPNNALAAEISAHVTQMQVRSGKQTLGPQEQQDISDMLKNYPSKGGAAYRGATLITAKQKFKSLDEHAESRLRVENAGIDVDKL
jgi:hypothetical protein